MRLSRLASFVATWLWAPGLGRLLAAVWAGGLATVQPGRPEAAAPAPRTCRQGWIGGNFVANSGAEFANDTPIPTSNYAALTVTGSLTGTQVTVNNNGSAAVGLVAGGNISTTNQSIVNNGGGAVNGNASNITFNGGRPMLAAQPPT